MASEKKKAMISQPMRGLTDEQIKATRDKAVKILEDRGYEVVNTFFDDELSSTSYMEEVGIVNIPVRFLARSIAMMATCHAVYFCSGWKEARGCCIEHDVATAYGYEMIHEE